ncbi:MAG: gamma-glutamylcyclotransferase [Erysipelotrichaceae bacterium]|nr:gamma-glutamylcyclotransferase [Erysipelotrichaceae bacterium]
MNKIFVYGTLRKGMYYHHYLEHEKFCGYGYIKGSLYSLVDRHYPGFILAGNHLVKGEIYQVDDDKLKLVDELESYFGENNVNNEYDKELINIYDENLHMINQAYVYILNTNNSFNTLDQIIANGDFVEYYKR